MDWTMASPKHLMGFEVKAQMAATRPSGIHCPSAGMARAVEFKPSDARASCPLAGILAVNSMMPSDLSGISMSTMTDAAMERFDQRKIPHAKQDAHRDGDLDP